MGKQPSTLQYAQYGGIALVLRDAMKAKGFTAATLNEEMGLQRSHAQIYGFLSGAKAPSEQFRNRLAQALAIDARLLMPKPVTMDETEATVAWPKDYPGASTVGEEVPGIIQHALDATGPGASRTATAGLVTTNLGFHIEHENMSLKVHQNGMVHLQIKLELPLAKAIALLHKLQQDGLL